MNASRAGGSLEHRQNIAGLRTRLPGCCSAVRPRKIGAYAAMRRMSSAACRRSASVVIATEVLARSPSSSAADSHHRIPACRPLLTALIFHANFADQIEMISFLKNVSIAGGFLLLVGNGAGPLSVDRRRAR
jgi:putative oxidoreductase